MLQFYLPYAHLQNVSYCPISISIFSNDKYEVIFLAEKCKLVGATLDVYKYIRNQNQESSIPLLHCFAARCAWTGMFYDTKESGVGM